MKLYLIKETIGKSVLYHGMSNSEICNYEPTDLKFVEFFKAFGYEDEYLAECYIEKYKADNCPLELYSMDFATSFSAGQKYSVTDWFTGGTSIYKVTLVEDGEVTFEVSNNELDGEHSRKETYKINKVGDDEQVELFEYKGHVCMIKAKVK